MISISPTVIDMLCAMHKARWIQIAAILIPTVTDPCLRDESPLSSNLGGPSNYNRQVVCIPQDKALWRRIIGWLTKHLEVVMLGLWTERYELG